MGRLDTFVTCSPARFDVTHRPEVGLDLDGRAAGGGLAGTHGGHRDLDEGGGHGESGHFYSACGVRCELREERVQV